MIFSEKNIGLVAMSMTFVFCLAAGLERVQADSNPITTNWVSGLGVDANNEGACLSARSQAEAAVEGEQDGAKNDCVTGGGTVISSSKKFSKTQDGANPVAQSVNDYTMCDCVPHFGSSTSSSDGMQCTTYAQGSFVCHDPAVSVTDISGQSSVYYISVNNVMDYLATIPYDWEEFISTASSLSDYSALREVACNHAKLNAENNALDAMNAMCSGSRTVQNASHQYPPLGTDCTCETNQSSAGWSPWFEEHGVGSLTCHITTAISRGNCS